MAVLSKNYSDGRTVMLSVSAIVTIVHIYIYIFLYVFEKKKQTFTFSEDWDTLGTLSACPSHKAVQSYNYITR